MIYPIGSHVNEDDKSRKKMKIETFEKNNNNNNNKNALEIWWRVSYPQKLAWIHATVSDKPEFTDDGRATDGRPTDDGRKYACAMTVALLTKSIRAKKSISIWREAV